MNSGADDGGNDAGPLDPPVATKLALEIVLNGAISYSTHALKEMANDGIEDLDVRNVLRAGRMPCAAECEHGSWRYRMVTAKFTVIFVFRGRMELRVVTAWRLRTKR